MKRIRSRLLVVLGTIVLASVLVQMLPHGSMYAADQDREEIVAFNTKSHKYHCLECTWAKKCTVNCVNIPKSEAIRRGGVPCKVCDGTCRSKLGRIPVEIEQNYRITYGDTVQSRVRGWAVRRNGSQ